VRGHLPGSTSPGKCSLRTDLIHLPMEILHHHDVDCVLIYLAKKNPAAVGEDRDAAAPLFRLGNLRYPARCKGEEERCAWAGRQQCGTCETRGAPPTTAMSTTPTRAIVPRLRWWMKVVAAMRVGPRSPGILRPRHGQVNATQTGMLPAGIPICGIGISIMRGHNAHAVV